MFVYHCLSLMHYLRAHSKLFSTMWKRQNVLRPPISAILRRNPLSPSPISLLFSPSSSSSSHTKFPPPSPTSLSSRTPSFGAFLYENNFSSDSSSNIRCWNCNSPPTTTPFLACDSCRSVQPLDSSVDYFQIFGLEKKYDIETINLEGKYKEWQKKLHPDLVHSKSKREREYAAEQSARVIDAYRTLSNPLSRAIYVLKLEGVDVDEEQTVSDPEMLAEILEIREDVEEAADSQALNQIHTKTQEKLNHWSESFANAFRSKQYKEAQTSIQRMTYYKRVNEEIVKKL